MTQQPVAKSQTFTAKYGARLQKDYPQLATSTINWEGLHKGALIRLRQFQMTNNYSADSIVIWAVWRLDVSIKKGKLVPCPEAWLKITMLRIVQELSRQHQDERVSLQDPDNFETSPTLIKAMMEKSAGHSQDEDDRSQLLRTALSKLSADKQELLQLRHFEGMSWQEVSEHYKKQGQEAKTATLRKRGERAQEELRQLVLQMIQSHYI